MTIMLHCQFDGVYLIHVIFWELALLPSSGVTTKGNDKRTLFILILEISGKALEY